MQVRFSAVAFAIFLLAVFSAAQSTSSKPELFDYDHEVAIGDDAFNDGNYADARQHYQNAADLAQQLHMTPQRIAGPLAGVASSLYHLHKYAEAEALFRQVLASRGKYPPAELWRMKETLKELGDSIFKQNRFDEAEPYYLRALALYDRPSDAPWPDVDACHHGSIFLQLGWIEFQRRAYDKAEARDQRALDIWVQSKQKCAVIVTAMEQLAILYKAQGKLDKAEETYSQTLPMLQKELQDEEPELVARQFDGLADIYLAENKNEQAAENYSKALSILQQIKPQPQQTLMNTLRGYALALNRLKRTEDALRVQSQLDAVGEINAQASDDPSVQLDGLLQQAAKAQGAQNLHEETSVLLQATQVAEKLSNRRDFRIGETYRRLGIVYQRQNQLSQAETALDSALAADEAAFGKNSDPLEPTLSMLGTVVLLEGKFDMAESLLLRELAIQEKSPVLNSTAQIGTMNRLSAVYFQTKKYDKAEAILKRELKLLQGNPDQGLLAVATGQLAAMYEADGRYDLAEKYYLQTLSADEQKFGPQSPVLQGPLWSLKELMIRMKRPEEASKYEARRQQIEQQLSQKTQLQKASTPPQ